MLAYASALNNLVSGNTSWLRQCRDLPTLPGSRVETELADLCIVVNIMACSILELPCKLLSISVLLMLQ